ncbi:MAG: RDD family protein [Acidimicrobiia bacterium]|nr:RDD family protein [Acidimicrobiia bacterium]
MASATNLRTPLAHRRLAAFGIDVTVVAVLISLASEILEPVVGLAGSDGWAGVTAWLVTASLPAAYVLVGEGRFATTLGKRAVEVDVVGPDGGPLGLRRAALRSLYRLSPVAWIGMFVSLRSGRETAWHDLWVGATVRDVGEPARPTWRPAQPARANESSEATRRSAKRVLLDRLRTTGPPPSPQGDATAPPAAVLAAAPIRAPGPNRRAPQRSAPGPSLVGRATPVRPPRVSCRCRELRRLDGADAVAYARGHLRTMAQERDRGTSSLVCLETRIAWIAREGWAASGNEPALHRVAELPGRDEPIDLRAEPERSVRRR